MAKAKARKSKAVRRSRPALTPAQLRSTAYHEAGHAVIGRVLALVCGSATIKPDYKCSQGPARQDHPGPPAAGQNGKEKRGREAQAAIWLTGMDKSEQEELRAALDKLKPVVQR
jgi:hypothetical protein